MFDTADIVPFPITLNNLFLAHGDPGPFDSHVGDLVDVVLVEFDFLSAEVAFGPLGQTPFLDDGCGLVEGYEFASDVTVEDGELPANMGAVEAARRGTGEGGKTLRVGERCVELFSGGAEFVGGGDGGRVNGLLGLSSCGWRGGFRS